MGEERKMEEKMEEKWWNYGWKRKGTWKQVGREGSMVAGRWVYGTGRGEIKKGEGGKQRRTMKTCLVVGFLTEHLESRDHHFLLVIHGLTCINTE